MDLKYRILHGLVSTIESLEVFDTLIFLFLSFECTVKSIWNLRRHETYPTDTMYSIQRKSVSLASSVPVNENLFSLSKSTMRTIWKNTLSIFARSRTRSTSNQSSRTKEDSVSWPWSWISNFVETQQIRMVKFQHFYSISKRWSRFLRNWTIERLVEKFSRPIDRDSIDGMRSIYNLQTSRCNGWNE